MPFPEGIVHFRNDRNGITPAVLTEPKAHWLKGIAKATGQTTQPDLPIDTPDASGLKLGSCPVEQGAPVPVVFGLDLKQGGAIQSPGPSAGGLLGGH